MTAFICVDNNNGLSFNKRRQSRDSEVIKDILSLSNNNISIKQYSEILFTEKNTYTVCDNYKTQKFFFFENTDISKIYNDFGTVVIYRWNRDYPYDVSLSALPDECGFTLKETTDFVGSSHEKITREIFVK